jgi:hypothetical protein
MGYGMAISPHYASKEHCVSTIETDIIFCQTFGAMKKTAHSFASFARQIVDIRHCCFSLLVADETSGNELKLACASKANDPGVLRGK